MEFKLVIDCWTWRWRYSVFKSGVSVLFFVLVSTLVCVLLQWDTVSLVTESPFVKAAWGVSTPWHELRHHITVDKWLDYEMYRWRVWHLIVMKLLWWLIYGSLDFIAQWHYVLSLLILCPAGRVKMLQRIFWKCSRGIIDCITHWGRKNEVFVHFKLYMILLSLCAFEFFYIAYNDFGKTVVL